MASQDGAAVAVQALQAGVCDYLRKPLRSAVVCRAVRQALAGRGFPVTHLLPNVDVHDPFGSARVLGASPAWQRLCQMVMRVAPSRATVLVTGESGTGKELIAAMLHRLSPRADRPFVVLSAAAIPATLLEAEIFGYEKGAFTKALQCKPGHFELAHGGTLFLDEIGDMPLELQAKVLRVLQNGTFQRLGGTRTLHADVRVVAATHKDLAREMATGRFRHDLYYRLAVITVSLPPLRHRRQDIPLLAAYFLRKYAQESHKDVVAIQPDALQRLLAHTWPGNVRELENVMARAVALAQGPTVAAADLGLEAQLNRVFPNHGEYFVLPAHATLAQIEREAIIQALRHSRGNRQEAARQLAISPATLYRKFKVHQISMAIHAKIV